MYQTTLRCVSVPSGTLLSPECACPRAQQIPIALGCGFSTQQIRTVLRPRTGALRAAWLLLVIFLSHCTPRSWAAVHYQPVIAFGPAALGQKPYVGVIQGRDGALYGTTLQGGSNSAGAVFKINKDGSGYKGMPHCASNGVDGQGPLIVIQAADGALCGTTSIGGSNKVGTVFKLSIDNTGYRVLHQFGSVPADGESPKAGVVQASDGWFYGTTFFGG